MVVMEPVKGGTLASFPEDIERIYKDYAPEKSVASWVLRFIASQEGLMTVLSFPTIPCTGCRYCVPGCPMSIQIPDLFTEYNSIKTYGPSRRYETWYKGHTRDGHGTASACIGCGQCEGVCPQHLEIISLLKNVSEEFDKE